MLQITRRHRIAAMTSLLLLPAAAAPAAAQPSTSLARYFGFEDPRILVVDDAAGPVFTADFNGDGRIDLGVVNNRKSRIELHLQREKPLSTIEIERAYRVNELPPNPFYDRVEVSVASRITAVAPHDVDGDGMLDLIAAAQPAEILVLRQTEPMMFDIVSRRRARGLTATRSAFEVADVTGGPAPELLAAVNGQVHVFPMSSSGVLGEPTPLGSGRSDDAIIAFFCEDFDGDGMTDILGVVPEHTAPLRLWRQQSDAGASSSRKSAVIGPELRFEMPALREVDPVRFPGRDAASIVVIERASRRVVLYDLATESIEPTPSGASGERNVQARVYAFSEGETRDRSFAIVDLDGDGARDLLATDAVGNRIILRRQRPGLGLSVAESFSAFKAPKTIAAGAWDDDETPEIFVLSEEEKTVGVSEYDESTGRISFPQPISIATPGAEPGAMNHVVLADGPAVAIVVRDRRDHALEIHHPNGASHTIALKDVRRPPQSILAADVDRDGGVDLLLLTPGEPMVMVRADDQGALSQVLTDKEMPQFGLVQAAGPRNTALLDVNGDGMQELLIADRNFVRACVFDTKQGWRVIDQITAPDAATAFSALSVMRAAESPYGSGDAIVASDPANRRLIIMTRGSSGWRIADTLRLEGFAVGAIDAGRFTGGATPSLLALSDEAFAVIPLAGRLAALEPVDAFRAEEENRLEHEIAAGDLNGDGYVDLAVLDANEQMCSILTLSARRRFHFASEFMVFESRLFTGGQARQFEPSEVLISDVTGDGGEDLILLAHDRVIIYPQMLRPQ
ncbi:MAG: VCBS repeat-containing protein [Planctomycetota bacterium]|nr:VCBS repeat-containing protein [Planctomycetota bacterium]